VLGLDVESGKVRIFTQTRDNLFGLTLGLHLSISADDLRHEENPALFDKAVVKKGGERGEGELQEA
jgi:hypothetical protein